MKGKGILGEAARSLLAYGVLLLLGLLLFSSSLEAALYAYVDENGVFHFTNVPTNPRYRLVERRTFSPFLSGLVGKYDREIQAACRQCGIDPDLVRSIIQVESDFNPRAISVKGAQGLMQLMPGTAQDLKVSNPFHPRENIRGGVRYLRYLLDLFNGDLVLALAAYNAGENAVLRYRSVPPYPETRAYIHKVLSLYDTSLETQLNRLARKGGGSKEQSPSASPRSQIYKRYRIFEGERIVVYTNIPVSP
ncbi:MAG: transglycosylase SLT domain-containing protein [candidate division NC10 bacterium]|nr:transglycosylase SLT domain-containing protein [candidate division NC10 bacterium]